MKRFFKRISVIFFVIMMSMIILPSTAYAKNGFNKKPDSGVGFEEDKKTHGQKVKSPSGDYGWRDTKGRVWVPDGKMHGGKGWTREYPDGSHDHVYDGTGNVRKHNSQSNTKTNNWLLLALGIVVLGVTILSPIPGDEVILGGALLGF